MTATVVAAAIMMVERKRLRRKLSEIDVFIVLPVCVVNQLEEKWKARRRRANEPKKEPRLPPGQTGAPESSSSNSCSSLALVPLARRRHRLLAFREAFSFRRRQVSCIYTTPRTRITRSKEQPRDIQDSGPLNFSAIAFFGSYILPPSPLPRFRSANEEAKMGP